MKGFNNCVNIQLQEQGCRLGWVFTNYKPLLKKLPKTHKNKTHQKNINKNHHQPLEKPARLIVRLLFGFASDLTNSTNLQIVRRQCCLPATYFLGVRSQELIISLRIQTLNEHLERWSSLSDSRSSTHFLAWAAGIHRCSSPPGISAPLASSSFSLGVFVQC